MRWHWLSKTLFGFSLSSFFNDFNHEMITALLPLVVIHLTGSAYAPLALGIIAGLSTLARSCGDLAGGWLSNKIKNQKMLLVLGYAITPLFSCLIGTAHAVFVVLMYRIIAWFGRGLREPVRDAWLTRILSSQDYGKGFGFLRAFDTSGAILGPLVAYFAVARTSLGTIFLIALVPGILSIASVIYLIDKHQVKTPTFNTSYRRVWKELPVSFKRFLAIRFLFGIAQFDSVMIILRAQEAHTGTAASSILATGWALLLYTFFNAVRLVSEFGIGFLSDFYQRISKRIFLAVLGFGTFSAATFLLRHASISSGVWFVIFTLAAVSLASTTVLEKTYAAHLIPHELLAQGYALLLMLIGISSVIAGTLIGSIWSTYSPNSAFGCASGISFLAMILLLLSKE